MENNKIKKECEQETDDFIKALRERDAKKALQQKDAEKGSDFDIDKKNPFKIDVYLSEEELLNSGKQALRYNEGKLKWSLVDWKSIEPMVRVLEMGAKKYAPYNWTKGMPVTEISESLLRHMFAFLNGEDMDKESKIEHLGHVMCNAMFLVYMMREKPEFDDRVKINKNDNGQ